MCGCILGSVPFREGNYLRRIAHQCLLSDPFVPNTQRVTALSSAQIDLRSVGTGSGEARHPRSCLLETKLASKHSVVKESDSSCGKASATKFAMPPRGTHTRNFDMRTCRSSSRGAHEASKGCRGPASLRHLVHICVVKTEALLRHIHRCNMPTARDDVFKIESILVEYVQDVSSARAGRRRRVLHAVARPSGCNSSVSRCLLPSCWTIGFASGSETRWPLPRWRLP